MIKPHEVTYIIENDDPTPNSLDTVKVVCGGAVWTQQSECDVCVAMMSSRKDFLCPPDVRTQKTKYTSCQWKYVKKV